MQPSDLPWDVGSLEADGQGSWPASTCSEPAVYPSPLRPEVLRVVREQVRTGLYRPPVDEVAEQLVAWLFADDWARTDARAS